MDENYFKKNGKINIIINKIIENAVLWMTGGLLYFYLEIFLNCYLFGYNRYCISVSKKIGKANIRNLFKRRIKDILMKNNIVGSFDYVIILRKAILDVSYNKMRDELINLMEVK